MAVKNKRKDRDRHGRIKRQYTGSYSTFCLNHTPKWWVRLYMNRPKRRKNKILCIAVMRGADTDGLVHPLGNRKPHEYYW